ncbi:hypothetical protein BS78_02G267300, partial [Paspalum vaginatum]
GAGSARAGARRGGGAGGCAGRTGGRRGGGAGGIGVHDAAVAVAVAAELLDGQEPAAEVGHVALHEEEALAEGEVLLLEPRGARLLVLVVVLAQGGRRGGELEHLEAAEVVVQAALHLDVLLHVALAGAGVVLAVAGGAPGGVGAEADEPLHGAVPVDAPRLLGHLHQHLPRRRQHRRRQHRRRHGARRHQRRHAARPLRADQERRRVARGRRAAPPRRRRGRLALPGRPRRPLPRRPRRRLEPHRRRLHRRRRRRPHLVVRQRHHLLIHGLHPKELSESSRSETLTLNHNPPQKITRLAPSPNRGIGT